MSLSTCFWEPFMFIDTLTQCHTYRDKRTLTMKAFQIWYEQYHMQEHPYIIFTKIRLQLTADKETNFCSRVHLEEESGNCSISSAILLLNSTAEHKRQPTKTYQNAIQSTKVLLLRSQLYLRGSPFWVRFLRMWPYFKSNYWGSHILSLWMVHVGCVFVASIHPFRTWMSGSFESCDGMYVCTD